MVEEEQDVLSAQATGHSDGLSRPLKLRIYRRSPGKVVCLRVICTALKPSCRYWYLEPGSLAVHRRGVCPVAVAMPWGARKVSPSSSPTFFTGSSSGTLASHRTQGAGRAGQGVRAGGGDGPRHGQGTDSTALRVHGHHGCA